MENTNNHPEMMDDEFEDSLSLCDLPLHQETETNNILVNLVDHDQGLPYYCLSTQDSFKFSSTPSSKTDPIINNIVFCGKSMSCKMEEPAIDFFDGGRSSLFPLGSTHLLSNNNRSNSFHLQTSKPSPSLHCATRSFRCQSGSSRKHKFMIGLVRIPTEMELGDMRKRQSRQAPVSMFPAKLAGDEAANGSETSGREGKRGPLRPWKCRSYLARGLTKAYLGCMPLA